MRAAFGASPRPLLIIIALALATLVAMSYVRPALAVSDISITVSDSPDPVAAGAQVSYTVTVSNGGPDPATNTTFTFQYDSRLTPVTGLADPASTAAGGFTFGPAPFPAVDTVQGSIPTMNNGQFARVTFIFQVNPAEPVGTILTNTATVIPTVPDLNPANNVAVETTTTSAFVPGADLQIENLFFSGGQSRPGGNGSFSVRVFNAGPLAGTNVVLSLPIPLDSTFVSLVQNSGPAFTINPPAGGGPATATIANLPLNGLAQFTFTVTWPPAIPPGGLISVTASVSSATADPNLANNSRTIQQTIRNTGPDQSVLLADAPDPVNAGANITYAITLSVTVNGAQDSLLTFAIPANTTFVSATQTSGTQIFTMAGPAGGAVTFSKLNFANNNTVTFQVVVTVNAGTPGGTVINASAVATSGTNFGQGELTPADNTATTTTTVAGGTGAPPPGPTTTVPTPVVGSGSTSPTASATATPTATPTTSTAVPFVAVPPQVFQNPGAIGAIMNGSRNNTPVPSRSAAVSPATSAPALPAITPPGTGDAGLKPLEKE